ncbi:MAG: hypothetical protein AAFP76_15725 [Bacteroidota bacterium]
MIPLWVFFDADTESGFYFGTQTNHLMQCAPTMENKVHFMLRRLLSFFFFLCISLSVSAQLDAEIQSLDFPNEMDPSINYQLDLKLENTGSETLSRSNCKLEVTYLSGPDDEAGEAFETNRDLYVNLSPGDEYTFRWTIKSPDVPGTYKVEVALVNGSNTLAKKDVSISIDENFEAELTFKIPNVLEPERKYPPLSATVKNTGETTWPEGKYELRSKQTGRPSGAGKDDMEAFEFEEEMNLSNLAPGASEFLGFKEMLETPTQGGSYYLEVGIYKDGKPFDAKNASIKVSPNVVYEEQEASMKFKVNKKIYAGETENFSVTIENSGKISWDAGSYELRATVTGKTNAKIDAKLFEGEMYFNANEWDPGDDATVKLPTLKVPEVSGDVKVKYEILMNGKPLDIEGSEATIEYEIVVLTKSTTDTKKKPQSKADLKAKITENVKRKLYPEKEYIMAFKIENPGSISWEKGSYKLKAKVTRKPSSGFNTKLFDGEISFDGSGLPPRGYKNVKFPKAIIPGDPGRVEVDYWILKDGKPFDVDGSELGVIYEIMEIEPELNIDRITLEKKMTSGKTYKLKMAVNNNGDIIALRDHWEVKSKIRSKKPSNYKPPRGVFDIAIDGIEIKSKETKYIDGSLKIPKVTSETNIRLEFEVYYKGKKMGGPKTYDIVIKP